MLIPVDTLLQPCHLKVSPDAPLRSVLPLMQQSPWPILPIVVGERLVGSLTVIDLVRAIDRADDGYWHQHHAVDNPGDRHRGDRREDQAPRTQTDPQITVVTCLSQVVIPIPTTGQIDLFDMGQRMHLSASSYLLAQDDRGQLLGLISLDRVWSQLGRLDWVMELLTETTLADLRPLPSLTVTPRTPLRQVARLMIGHPGQGALGVRPDPSVGAGEARSGEPLLGIITAAHLLQTWLNDPTAVAERAMTPLPPPIPLQTPLAALWDRLQPRQSQPGQLQPGQSQSFASQPFASQPFASQPFASQPFAVVTETGALAGLVQTPDLLTIFTPRYLYQKNQRLQQRLTEQAQTLAQEQADRQNIEARLHEITSTISQVFFIRAITGEFLYISPAYEDLWGRSCDQLYAYPEDWLNAVYPEDLAIVQASVRSQFRGEGDVIDREYRIIQPEGMIRWIRARVTPVRGEDGQILRFIGTAEDITDRKQVELALLEQEKFLRSIYEHVHDGIFVVDVLPNGDLRYVSINAAQSQLLGMDTDEFYGQTPEQVFSPNAAAWVRQQYQHCIAVGDSITYEEMLPFQGQDYWWKTSLTPLKDNTGRIYRLVGTCANITSLKQTETALRRSLQEKEILLAEVHHRVKNNLQIVSSLLSLQANRIQDKTAYAALIESRNRISTMALIHEHLYQSEDLTHINFLKYVERLVISIFSSYASLSERIAYDINISPEATIHLEQSVIMGLILNELINNALQHAFPETILATQRSATIGIQLETTSSETLTLTVWDNGMGLPPNFNLSHSQSMGLRLVHTLTSQLSGSLDIQPRNPTIFKLTFAPKPC